MEHLFKPSAAPRPAAADPDLVYMRAAFDDAALRDTARPTVSAARAPARPPPTVTVFQPRPQSSAAPAAAQIDDTRLAQLLGSKHAVDGWREREHAGRETSENRHQLDWRTTAVAPTARAAQHAALLARRDEHVNAMARAASIPPNPRELEAAAAISRRAAEERGGGGGGSGEPEVVPPGYTSSRLPVEWYEQLAKRLREASTTPTPAGAGGAAFNIERLRRALEAAADARPVSLGGAPAARAARQAMAEAACVEALVGALAPHARASAALAALGCRAIVAVIGPPLGCDPTTIDAATRAGAAAVAADAIGAHPRSVDARRWACDALAALAATTPGAVGVLAAKGAAAAAAALAASVEETASADAEAAALAALRALARLTAPELAGAELPKGVVAGWAAIAAEGGLAALARALAAGSAAVASSALIVARNLSALASQPASAADVQAVGGGGSLRGAVRGARLGEAVLRAAAAHPANAELQRSAVETLVALLQQGAPYHDAAGRKALRGAGAGALLSATAARAPHAARGRSIGERAATALSLLG